MIGERQNRPGVRQRLQQGRPSGLENKRWTGTDGQKVTAQVARAAMVADPAALTATRRWIIGRAERGFDAKVMLDGAGVRARKTAPREEDGNAKHQGENPSERPAHRASIASFFERHNPLHYLSRKIRTAPDTTTKAISAPIARSGKREPVHATSAPATMTPTFAMTSLVEKIQLAFI